jgi:hypothetical protein
MGAKKKSDGKSTLSQVVFYATIASGLVAAYLMYRRGESLGTIARRTVTNPVGSMISEVTDAV